MFFFIFKIKVMKQRDIGPVFLDAFGSAVALYFAFLLRFEFIIPGNLLMFYLVGFLFLYLSRWLHSLISGIYSRMWRYTSLFDLYAIISAVVTSSCVSFIYVLFNMDQLVIQDQLYYYILFLIL